MASLKLEHIYKVYPNGTKAVNDFTMDIKDGEFIVFVGPSGCGKSTTLRMIAGLEEITAGELYIENNIVNSVEPKDRDVAMVFQNYALYPHMTIYDNMAFGLKLRHEKNEVIHEKVLWAADVLGIKEYLDRKPRAMSGGQRQRVALGRAILRDPKVMLLDEPLSNLDAKLRTQMRSEIAKLHQNLKTTFIYVTHDQTEAMTLGTRVVVMKLGRVQQIDSPKNLYNYPVNKFVAGFIGTPQMNFFQGTLLRKKDKVEIQFAWSDAKIVVPYNDLLKVRHSYLDGKTQVYIGIRCENISLADPKDKENVVDVKVSHFEELGSETLIYGDINMQGDGFEETSTRVILKTTDIGEIKIGDVVRAKFDMKKANFFDLETEDSILPRIPESNVFDGSIEGGVLKFLDINAKLPKAIKVADAKDIVITIPSNAITLDKGEYKATVQKVEKIGEQKLVYLVTDDRTFFALDNAEHKEGEVVSFDIDFTKLSVADAKGEPVITPIAEFDDFRADFYNYTTVMTHANNPKFEAELNDKIAAVTKEYADKKEDLAKALEADKASYASADAAKKLETAKAEYDKLVAEGNEKIARIKADGRISLTEAKQEHKAKVKEIKVSINEEFKKRKQVEKTTYARFMAENKDKLAIRRRKEEHRVFKESTPGERESDLSNALANEGLDYDSKKSQIKSVMHREIVSVKKAIKEKKAEVDFLTEPNKALDKKYAKDLANLNKEEKKAIRKAKLIFFFRINSFYIEADELISGKLIQGLGTRVFSSDFIISVPHDAYVIGDEGIQVKIVDNLDYGTTIYAKGEVVAVDGTIGNIYIKTPKPIAVDTCLTVVPDIIKTQISETSMNIRLY